VDSTTNLEREEFNHEPHEQGANLESGGIYYKYARKERN